MAHSSYKIQVIFRRGSYPRYLPSILLLLPVIHTNKKKTRRLNKLKLVHLHLLRVPTARAVDPLCKRRRMHMPASIGKFAAEPPMLLSIHSIFVAFHWLRMLWFSDWLIYSVEFVKSDADPAHGCLRSSYSSSYFNHMLTASAAASIRWSEIWARAHGSGTGYLWLNWLKRHIRFVRIHNVESIGNSFRESGMLVFDSNELATYGPRRINWTFSSKMQLMEMRSAPAHCCANIFARMFHIWQEQLVRRHDNAILYILSSLTMSFLVFGLCLPGPSSDFRRSRHIVVQAYDATRHTSGMLSARFQL